ncbi:ATP-dependent DNA helicase PIF1 [Mycena indigotica]|uniref:U4/U6 snRNA-associated-splicing factor PRP24 n=1 Tax=Mycena indigotica TaxID=2126181 RepID=A0A8H6W4B4_9AGAR|nr:ATP-dependent DNA helicase PIF1 [Mycena indigotica]KAF7301263.1 ATP-dependent DNA helicase PIF1 [Mycena indigotica]
MDEAQSLDALSAVLTGLESQPFDSGLHAKHIKLTQSLQQDPQSAIELMTSCIAAPEEVWLARIRPAEAAVDVASAESVEEVLSLYKLAEDDYMSLTILKKHAEFVVACYNQYKETEKPAEFDEQFSAAWTREALTEIVDKTLRHPSNNEVWNVLREWELDELDAVPEADKLEAVTRVEKFILARLALPHPHLEEVAQGYSSFTTKHKPTDAYESLLVAASKIRGKATKAYQKRESWETTLSQTPTLENFALRITSERRAKNPDWSLVKTLFERAIAEAAKRMFNGEEGVESILKTFWNGYSDAARILGVGTEDELGIFLRAVRSVPGSGETWARYLRCLERAGEASVADIYDKALSSNLLQSNVEELVPLILARGSYEKRLFESSEGDEDRFVTLVATLEAGVDLVRKASTTGDARLRVEKFLVSVYDAANMEDSGLEILHASAKHNKTSYNAWITYTDALIRHGRHDQARKTFVDLHAKNLDWPEALWEAWLAFEHLHGSVQELETCGDKIEKAQYVVNTRRAKDAERQAAQYAAQQMASVPVEQAPVPQLDSVDAVPMEVDSTAPGPRGKKRAAEDPSLDEGNKKPKLAKTAPLKRDRENCTVFVADLPSDVTEDDLVALFKDCGDVREVKIRPLAGAVVATVEMADRENIPAALTKDKKRVRGKEIAVHLAWKSTLYVANYPESADDATLRELFGKYGTLFDVRWPSKKFKETRRFSYVQFTSPMDAEKALELHGRELEPGLPLTVLISNPERKKARTDQDANDRELYVAGLSKHTSKQDLQNLFKAYGIIKEVRLATDNHNQCKGFAFVEFEEQSSAQDALEANNQELKGRRIAVTLADSRARKSRGNEPDNGLGKKADTRSRSVRVRNLPAGTQEGLLQQVLEKIAQVKRVEVFADTNEAVVELGNAAEAGKLLLRTEPIEFEGQVLTLSEESSDQKAAKKEGSPCLGPLSGIETLCKHSPLTVTVDSTDARKTYHLTTDELATLPYESRPSANIGRHAFMQPMKLYNAKALYNLAREKSRVLNIPLRVRNPGSTAMATTISPSISLPSNFPKWLNDERNAQPRPLRISAYQRVADDPEMEKIRWRGSLVPHLVSLEDACWLYCIKPKDIADLRAISPWLDAQTVAQRAVTLHGGFYAHHDYVHRRRQEEEASLDEKYRGLHIVQDWRSDFTWSAHVSDYLDWVRVQNNSIDDSSRLYWDRRTGEEEYTVAVLYPLEYGCDNDYGCGWQWYPEWDSF